MNHNRSRPLASLPLLLAVLLAGTFLRVDPAHAAKEDPALLRAQAQAKLDRGDAMGALPLLERAVKSDNKNAQGYLLRATARLMLGEDSGRQDLDRAIALDPTLRQAYLDRAGLAIAEKRYPAALADFEKARELAPADPDGTLNVGVAQLLLGNLDAAAKSFSAYLGAKPGNAQAYYLVARNYALTGYAGLAVQNLQQAVALDERTRAAARNDNNFVELQQNPRFQELLRTDAYKIPADAHRAQRSYTTSYDAGRGPLLRAVIDALGALREPFGSSVEAAPDWGIIWGAMRIKMYDSKAGEAIVELSAPAASFTPDQFEQRSRRLLDSIAVQVIKHRPNTQIPQLPSSN